MALQAKANDPDTPNWFEATIGPFAKEFWDACYTEIDTLEIMGVWDVVDCEDSLDECHSNDMGLLYQRLPSGEIKKLKA
jgi:hypothetical protein